MDVSWSIFHGGMVSGVVNPSFISRRMCVKRPSKGRPARVVGHDELVPDACWSVLNSAFQSRTNRFQTSLLLQRSDATMAADSAVWIVHVSYPNLLGSLARTGLDAAEELLK